jgi:putative transcriptional regulator
VKTISQVEKHPREKTKLWQLREAAGLSRRELTTHVGVCDSTISLIERGHSPNVRTAILLARFFETTVEELFGELV